MSKLPPNRREAAKDSLKKFIADPKLPGLNFEPVRNATGFFTIRANAGDRIVLEKIEDGYLVADIGTHDIYRKLNRRNR